LIIRKILHSGWMMNYTIDLFRDVVIKIVIKLLKIPSLEEAKKVISATWELTTEEVIDF